MSDIYSYHTFLFPFVWEGRGKHSVPLAKFLELFENNVNWENVDMPDEHHITPNPQILNMDDALLFYKEYQYFHPYARKALYGFAEDIVTNYSFRPKDIRNLAHYYITRTDEKGSRKYCLLVNAIKLKIYNTGVAIFILECENHGVGETLDPESGKVTGKLDQRTLSAVKEINDYGRRVALPYLPTPPYYSSLTADSLTLDIDSVGTFQSDFRKFAKEMNSLETFERTLSLTHFCDFIKKILQFGRDDIRFTSKLTDIDKNTYYIYPALDDRMFVVCYVMDSAEIAKFTKRKDDGELVCLTDDTLSKSLHELIAIDPPGNCCTQDMNLRKSYLETHMYNRWIDYGTLTTYTNQSLINLTTTDCPSYLTDSFLTQYVQLCCLVLVQRASIINFQRQTSAISAHVEERGRQIKLSTVSEVMKLQERFVAFQNQLSFTEVSPQDQGIEIYDKLMEFCFIEKELDSLKNQLDCLCNAANTSLDYNFNKYALIFAVPTLVSEVAITAIDILGTNNGNFNIFSNLQMGLYGLSGLVVVWLLIKYRRRK
ncbi:MAG: hypothetical protein IJF78_02160 [Clostridia bacterium]|nr:hypothetical protein [Clostridia bacterium]